VEEAVAEGRAGLMNVAASPSKPAPIIVTESVKSRSPLAAASFPGT
jgi:hypothetical protein